MKPNPAEAQHVLENAMSNWFALHKSDLMEVVDKALGLLRGYELPLEVLAKYKCSVCDISGVKLWRPVNSSEQAWCAKCGMAQAGLSETINDDGTHVVNRIRDSGRWSDQIYNPTQGQNLIPWVPTSEGFSWGYGCVPPEGCVWWRSLPTYLEQP